MGAREIGFWPLVAGSIDIASISAVRHLISCFALYGIRSDVVVVSIVPTHLLPKNTLQV
jgi:hypothetical protein